MALRGDLADLKHIFQVRPSKVNTPIMTRCIRAHVCAVLCAAMASGIAAFVNRVSFKQETIQLQRILLPYTPAVLFRPPQSAYVGQSGLRAIAEEYGVFSLLLAHFQRAPQPRVAQNI
eukprot:48994-Eustigmatos_ZCMA.PRE.2